MSSKLSALTLGNTPDYFYGIEGGSPRKYHGLGIINVKDFGATDGGDSTDAIQNAISAAFGVAVFKGGTGGVSTDVLTVASGTVPTYSGTLATPRGVIYPGTYLRIDGVALTDGTTILPYGTAGTTGTGGAGTYKLSHAQNIANGTTLAVSNSIAGASKNKTLYFPAGNFIISSPIYMIDVYGGVILGSGAGTSQMFYYHLGTEGNLFSIDPTITPFWYCDGWANGRMSGFSLGCNATKQVNKFTNNSTSAGGTVLHIADTTGIVQNMRVYSFSDPSSLLDGISDSIVTSLTSNTVTISSAVPGGKTVANGASLGFVTGNMGIVLAQSGWFNQTTSIEFQAISIYGTHTDFLGNLGNSSIRCEGCAFINCNIRYGAVSGIRTLPGAVNWSVLGGEVNYCGTASTYDPVIVGQSGNLGAAYSALPGSSIAYITNWSCDGNTWDSVNAGHGMVISGGRSEGGGVAPVWAEWTAFIDGGDGFSGVPGDVMHVTSVQNGVLYPGIIISGNPDGAGGYIGGNYYIASQISGITGGVGEYRVRTSSSSTLGDGDLFKLIPSQSFVSFGRTVSQGIATVNTTTTLIEQGWGAGTCHDTLESGRYLDATFGGVIYASGINYGPNDVNTPQVFVGLGSSGALISDGLLLASHSDQTAVKGSGNARITLRGNFWVPHPVDPNLIWDSFNFTGKVVEYSDAITVTDEFLGASPFIVSRLPTPNARWKMAKPLIVTDSNITAIGNVGTDISTHGGGSHIVRVHCPEGTAWLIC